MKIKALLGLGLLALSAHAAFAASYSGLYVFGDSLSDAGNLYAATGGAQPAAPYSAGRFSNGPLWIQDVAANLGLGAVTPSLLGGNDYAFGYATTGLAATNNPVVPSLTNQVGMFLSANPIAPGGALYSVWIGANDVFNIIDSGVSLSTAQQQAQDAALVEANAIGALVGAGARSFVVPLLPDLGATPALIAGGAAAVFAGHALSAVYNSALVFGLSAVLATPGVTIAVPDIYSLMDGLVANPASAGLTDVTDACYVGPYTGGGSVCATPDSYLFWDQVHPSAATGALIAAAVETAIPEPASAALMVLGLVSLVRLRRRRG